MASPPAHDHEPKIEESKDLEYRRDDHTTFYRMATGKPTVFCSSNWLQNNKFTGDVEHSFLRSYRQQIKKEELKKSAREANHEAKWHRRYKSDGSSYRASDVASVKRSNLGLGTRNTLAKDLFRKKSLDSINVIGETEKDLIEFPSNQRLTNHTLAKYIEFDNFPSQNEKKMLNGAATLGKAVQTFNNLKNPSILLVPPKMPDIAYKQSKSSKKILAKSQSPSMDRSLSSVKAQDEDLKHNQPIQKSPFGSALTTRRGSFANNVSTAPGPAKFKSKKIAPIEEDPQIDSVLRKLEFFKTFTRKGKDKHEDVFVNFRSKESERGSIGNHFRVRKKQIDKVQQNMRIYQDWQATKHERTRQMVDEATEKSKRAIFEKERAFVTKRMSLIFKSKIWSFGEEISTALLKEIKEKIESVNFVKNWITILYILRFLPGMKEKQVMYKIVEIFKKARQARFERVVAYAKKVAVDRIPRKRFRDMCLAGSGLNLWAKIYKGGYVADRAKAVIGSFFRRLHKVKLIHFKVKDTMRHLKKMSNCCVKFLKRVQFYKKFTKEQWKKARSEVLGDDFISSNSKLILQFEYGVCKLLYDYFDCYKVSNKMIALANSKKGSVGRKMVFDPSKLYKSYQKRENKVVTSIVLECLLKHLEKWKLEEIGSRKKSKPQASPTSMSNPLLKQIKIALKVKSKLSSGGRPLESNDPCEINDPVIVSPFQKVDLVKHVDVSLMAIIQQMIISRAAEIRASLVTEGRKSFRAS